MKVMRLFPVFAIAAIFVLLLMVAWMAGVFDDKLAPSVENPTLVQAEDVVPVIKKLIPAYELVAASIEARQATMISSRLLARIETIHVRAGDSIKKGDVLVELEKGDLGSRVSQARARVDSFNARLIEANNALKRAEELAGEQVLSQSELDQARAKNDALVADLDSARQFLHEAETALEYAVITAPIDGRIVDRFAEPGDTTQPGLPLLSLYNPLSMRVEANVRESLALRLEQEQALEVHIPSVDLTLVGTIEELVPAGDAGSRSFLVKARLTQSPGLRPGMYARLKVPAGSEWHLLMPAVRVASIGQLELVWVKTRDGVERRFVQLGKPAGDGMVEIIAGLSEGDLVMPIESGERGDTLDKGTR